MYKIEFIEEVCEKGYGEIVWAQQIFRKVKDLDELYDVWCGLKKHAGEDDPNRDEYNYNIVLDSMHKIEESD